MKGRDQLESLWHSHSWLRAFLHKRHHTTCLACSFALLFPIFQFLFSNFHFANPAAGAPEAGSPARSVPYTVSGLDNQGRR